jgi:hypothetical protein
MTKRREEENYIAILLQLHMVNWTEQESIRIYFKTLSQKLSGGNDQKYEKPQSANPILEANKRKRPSISKRLKVSETVIHVLLLHKWTIFAFSPLSSG